jgi:thiamine biosynthesis lipoprotein
MELVWKQFNALGTDVVVSAYLDPQDRYLLDRVQAGFFEFEQRFSRFITTSEISALNSFAGGRLQVSERLAELLARCKFYYEDTGGLFNPEVIDILEGVGYDRNFSDINANQLLYDDARLKRQKAKEEYLRRPRLSDLKIEGNTLDVPKGLKIDLGGIGKGYVVDLISREVLAGVENYWLSAGGDLLAKGNDGDKQGWQISVQNPSAAGKSSFSFNTLGQRLGIATSGVIKRRGIVGGLEWHHIIDPARGEPAKNDILSVSLIAPTTEQADVYAKTVLLLGKEAGMRFIEDRPDLEGAIYLDNQSAIFSSGLIKYL